jgi:hypothetical protein
MAMLTIRIHPLRKVLRNKVQLSMGRRQVEILSQTESLAALAMLCMVS